MAKWRTSEKPLQMATIVGFIASDSVSNREVLCLSFVFEQAFLRNTVVSEYIIGEFCIQFSLHFKRI